MEGRSGSDWLITSVVRLLPSLFWTATDWSRLADILATALFRNLKTPLISPLPLAAATSISPASSPTRAFSVVPGAILDFTVLRYVGF